MSQYKEEDFTFLPVTKAQHRHHLDGMMDIPNRPQRFSMPKGKYTKQYVMSLIKQILQHIEDHKLSGGNLSFTLKASLIDLLSHIELE